MWTSLLAGVISLVGGFVTGNGRLVLAGVICIAGAGLYLRFVKD